jgi:hypothetical protein
LKLIQASETTAKNKTLEWVKAECIKAKWGRKTTSGPTECSLKAHTLVTWLVNIMTNGFFFATKSPTNFEDRSYRQMLILLRNNGNQRVKRDSGVNLYKASMLANFEVCFLNSWDFAFLNHEISYLVSNLCATCTIQGFFPNGEATNLQPYAVAYWDIIGLSTKSLATYFAARVKQSAKKRNLKIIKMLNHMNCQTDIIEIVNHFGVVIQVPAVRKKDLPNLVALLNPSLGWCGTNPLCVDEEGQKVYSNVTKFIQLVVWTCMHPKNNSSELPFRFAWDKLAMMEFFTKQRIKGQGWMAINEEEKEKAENFNCQFEVIGHDKFLTLYELLHAILHDDVKEDSKAWKRWDTLLKSIPKTGMITLWSAPTESAALLVGKPEGTKYGTLCRTWGYGSDMNRKAVGPEETSTGSVETTQKKPRSSRKLTPKLVKPATAEEESSVDQDEDEANNAGTPATQKKPRSSRKLTPKLVKPATAEEESSVGQDEDEANNAGTPAQSSPEQSQNLNANSSAQQDEDGDNTANAKAEDEIVRKRKPTDKSVGTGQLTDESLVASVPKSVWDTPSDMDSTRAALHESAHIHVQKALFALTLSEAALISNKVPTKEDITDNFPLFHGKDYKQVLQKMGQPFIGDMKKSCWPIVRRAMAIDPSPDTGFSEDFPKMIINLITLAREAEEDKEEKDAKVGEQTKEREVAHEKGDSDQELESDDQHQVSEEQQQSPNTLKLVTVIRTHTKEGRRGSQNP